MISASTITAAEANRSFSKLLRAARNGQRVTITSHGEPVAVIGPVDHADLGREDALKEMKKRWAKTETVIAPWSREEIWDEITR
jgi:prevent-host-death family protein